MIVHSHMITLHGSLETEMRGLSRYKLEFPVGVVLLEVIRELKRKCVHCKRVPRLIRRPLQITFLAKRVGEILHSDYLYNNEFGYILTGVDSLSRTVQLIYSRKPDTEEVVTALMHWRANYGLVNQFLLVTDNDTHFSNRVLTQLQAALRTNEFTHPEVCTSVGVGV